jgi:signal transduction histidine kinase/CheY-like chemotaxis protein
MLETDHRFIFDSMDQAVIVHDQEGNVRTWNAAATSLFGYSPREVIGRNLMELIMRRDHSDAAPGRSVVLPVVDKQGKIFTVNIRTEVHGGLNYAFLDAPERELLSGPNGPVEENTAALESTASGLLRALEKADYVIFAKDRDGRYVEFNSCMLRLMNLGRRDLLGKTDYELFDEKEADQFRRNDLLAWSSGDVVSAVEMVFAQGEHRTFSVKKVVEDVPPGEQRLLCVGHDVTKLIQAQASVSQMENERLLEREQVAIQMSKTKTDFLATMSHEIRTPINAMIGFTTLLRETDLTAEQREYTDAVHRSCGILLSLINDILDFSKIEAGKVQPEMGFVDAGAIIKELLRDCYNPKRLMLRSDIVPRDRLFITTDGGRLRQILAIFFENALKFTFSGGITITGTHDEKLVHFHVIDTGIGIPQDAIKSLFQPFTQADATTTRRFGGTGLGLSISKVLANLLGGGVEVVSQEHRGSDFHLWLPYVEGKPEEGCRSAGLLYDEPFETKEATTHPPVKPKSRSEDDHGKHFILVVEDSPMNAKLMVRMLEKLGYRAVTATNGLEALNMLRLDPYRFSVCLMDCSMPVMDGYEATREIRKLPAPPGRMPIIALTANVLSGERQRVLDAGMNEYMAKPVFKQALSEAIERWLPIGAGLLSRGE